MHPIERLRYVARARGADAESLVRETAGALRGLGLDPSGLVVACRRIVERHPTCGPLWWLCARMLTSADPMAAARAAVDEIEADRTVDALVGRAARRRDGRRPSAGRSSPGMALARRGDVRVLAVDAGHQGSSFVQRLERSEVESELVPMEAAAIADGRADLVLVEADALDATRLVAATGSAVLAAAAGLAGDAGVVRRRLRPAAAGADGRRRSSTGSASSRSTRGRVRSRSLPLSLVAHVVGPDGGRHAGRRRSAPSARWRPSCCAPGSCSVRSRPWPSRRDQITMTDAEVAAFLDEQRCSTSPRSARAATRTSWRCGTRCVDGRPAFWTFGKSQKVVNLRRDPKITGLVESGDSYDRAARRRARRHGPAASRTTTRSLDHRPARRRQVPGRRRRRATRRSPFLEAQARKRVGVVIDVERTVSWDHTKLAGGY